MEKFFNEADSLKRELNGLEERIEALEEDYMFELTDFLEEEGFDVVMGETEKGEPYLRFSQDSELREVLTKAKYLNLIQGPGSPNNPTFNLRKLNGTYKGLTVQMNY